MTVDDVIAQLTFGEPVGREAVMGGQLPHRPEVGLLRALGVAGKLHVLDHSLSEFGHGEILQTGSKNESSGPTAGNPKRIPRARRFTSPPRDHAWLTHPAAKPLRRAPSMFDSLGVKVPHPT